MVGKRGFEPPWTGSEPGILPLDDSPNFGRKDPLRKMVTASCVVQEPRNEERHRGFPGWRANKETCVL